MQLNATMMDIVGKHLGILLTKVEKEYQHPIIKAELTPAPRQIAYKNYSRKHNANANSTLCNIQ